MTLEWSALWLTMQLATVTTAVLLVLATPVAWWLSTSRRVAVGWLEAIVALPLVLPPTVIGFYLLVAFAPDAFPGAWWQALTGGTLLFSFEGLVLASLIYSLPFAVQPLQTAFQGVSRELLEAATTLGSSSLDRFMHIVLPLSRRGYLTAAVLTFAHTVGEFGIVLMIGGNIPGETRVASLALYESVETLDYGSAHQMAAVLLVFSFAVLLVVYGLNRRIALGQERPHR
jgi:molybdate transport system permease protein